MSTCDTSRVTPVNNLIKNYEKGRDRIVKHSNFNLPCIGFPLRKYKKNYQKPQIEEQTNQWPKKKNKRRNNDLQNTAQKTKDRVTRPQRSIITEAELRCSGRVSSFSSTCGICHVTLVTNQVRSHESGDFEI